MNYYFSPSNTYFLQIKHHHSDNIQKKKHAIKNPAIERQFSATTGAFEAGEEGVIFRYLNHSTAAQLLMIFNRSKVLFSLIFLTAV